MQVLPQLPPQLLDCGARDLASALGEPTLLQLEGRRQPAVFLSVLLHGNETSGWDGVRRYLREHDPLPRSIDLFIGNVDAAAHDVRVLPGQRDFNRIWRGADGDEGALARDLQDLVGDRNYYAAIDLHNNSGHNPYYTVLTDVDADNCGLALSFSDKAVLVEEPDSTLTHWFARRCPAVALETGPIGDPQCTERVYAYLERCLDADSIEAAPAGALDLYRALARVHVCEDVNISFETESTPGSLILTGGVEAVNFHELPAGTIFASTTRGLAEAFRVLDPLHRDVTERFFEREGDDIVLRSPVTPAMYTTDPYVIRQDCLCYFMTRMQP